jgi:hypothetical protein
VSGWDCGCRRAARIGFDDDGAGGSCRVAIGVGGDVVDRIGSDLAAVDDDIGRERAIKEGADTEVEVGLRADDRGT